MPLDKLFPGSLYNVQQRRRCNDGPDATGRHQPAARAHATTGCLSPPFDVHEGPAAKTANRTFVWSLDNVHALLRCNDGDGDSGATSTFSERVMVEPLDNVQKKVGDKVLRIDICGSLWVALQRAGKATLP
ncbi:uncharacterized protein LOC142564533 isoform X2 [Dermacentor variabilis]|uniref:uncharacterized protein LOC142564533 isoform X2 n=1 Tax=Dermacentor variabilis TaxID=34621 RepID=UPI003F5C39DD